MYRMSVIYKFGRLSNETTVTGADRAACIAQIDAVLEQNPALEYTIADEGPVT